MARPPNARPPHEVRAFIGVLSDAGLTLITMALAPQMRMWNPYMNDSIRKGIDLGKGMLVGHGSDTKGFEYDTLPGATADVTLDDAILAVSSARGLDIPETLDQRLWVQGLRLKPPVATR